MTHRYFEDFAVGDRFRSAVECVTEEAIIQFGRQFDPQPFHTDPAAAQNTFFQGLVASGWHTTAITMKLLVGGEFKVPEGLIGLAVDGLCWPRPVRPGDQICVESEVLEAIPARSLRLRGTLKVRAVTVNQSGETVQSFIATMLVTHRPPSEG